jgi:L-iditol 2-dehydrogenase
MSGTFSAALLYAPGDVRVQEIAIPSVGPGEVLVRLRAVSLCPTDIRKYRSLKPEDIRLLAELGPIILGHEGAGEVVDTGAGVESLRRGDRVAIQTVIACGECAYCRDAQPSMCQAISGVGASVGPFDRYVRLYHDRGYGGCYAEYIKIPEVNAIRIPDSASFADASLFEPTADVVHSIARLGVGPDDSLVVVGLGPMGLLHVAVARAYGARSIIGIDPIARRRTVAQELGATCVIDPGAVDPIASVKQQTGGRGADKVSVAVGGIKQSELSAQAIEYLARRGVISLFAGAYPATPIAVDPNLIHYNQLTITGTVGYRPQDAAEAVRLIAEGHIQSQVICTPHMPLARIKEGLELYGSQDALKIALDL